MNQDKGAGHHAITKDAVNKLFNSQDANGNPRAVDGKIDGMTEQEYYEKLDASQREQDSLPGTAIPGKWAPDSQREHGLANPFLDGEHNRVNNENYVVGEMEQAKHSHDTFEGPLDGGENSEMQHLGNAAHSLEDSYSNAHTFRGDGATSDDPHAPIDSYNVFDPADEQSQNAAIAGGIAGATFGAEVGAVFGGVGAIPGAIIGGAVGAAAGWYVNNEINHDGEGTHDDRFDDVPVDADGHPVLNSDKKAVNATAEMLQSYYDKRDQSMNEAADGYNKTIEQDFKPGEGGVGVNHDNTDPAWLAERDRRLAERESEVSGAKDEKDGGSQDPTPDDSQRDGGADPGGAAQGADGDGPANEDATDGGDGASDGEGDAGDGSVDAAQSDDAGASADDSDADAATADGEADDSSDDGGVCSDDDGSSSEDSSSGEQSDEGDGSSDSDDACYDDGDSSGEDDSSDDLDSSDNSDDGDDSSDDSSSGDDSSDEGDTGSDDTSDSEDSSSDDSYSYGGYDADDGGSCGDDSSDSGDDSSDDSYSYGGDDSSDGGDSSSNSSSSSDDSTDVSVDM